MNIETGKRLYEFRKANGLSQEELAEKMQVSHQTVSKWERAESSPNTDNLIALAKLYGVTIDELLNGKEPPVKSEPDNKYSSEYTYENKSDFDNKDDRQSINFKNGIHIHDGRDNVDIGWKGIHIESQNGDKVHVGLDGINVQGSAKDHVFTRAPKNPWLHALLPTFAALFYLMLGFTTNRGWAVGWIIFLFIPIIETAVSAFKTKNPSLFCYPVLVTATYLILGMVFSFWHPSWILFITIPIYYILCDAYKKTRQNREDDFSQYSSANNTTYYSPPDTVSSAPPHKKHNGVAAVIIAVICALTLIIIVPIIGVFGFIESDSFENIVSNGIDSIVSNSDILEYDNEAQYSLGSAEIPTDNITEISVEWVSGNINVEYYDGKTISLSEPAQSNNDYTMRYLVQNNELKIKYCKSGRKHSNIGRKDLTIKIPNNFSLDELDISSVSSRTTVKGIIARSVDFGTVSGDLTASGSFYNIDTESVSGDVEIISNIAPASIDSETVSGDLKITVPENINGFTLDYETISGSIIDNSFNTAGNYKRIPGKSGNIVYGDGSTDIDFESVSGNFEIIKSAS